MTAGRTSFVIATRDRCEELRGNLVRLLERHSATAAPVIVVDNGSRDGTREMVRSLAASHPEGARLSLIPLPRNEGAVARNVGAGAATTEFVAFCDDDSWWDGGAPALAEPYFDSHPQLAVMAASTTVWPAGRRDGFSDLLARSPLGTVDGLPGPSILGFMSCAVIVRVSAFLSVGGFSPVLFFRGEEQLIAVDLAAAGHLLCFYPQLTTCHEPSASRPTAAAQHARVLRNHLLTCWMRRPADRWLPAAAQLLRRAPTDRAYAGATVEALLRLPAAMRQRRRLPPALEAQVRLLESQPD